MKKDFQIKLLGKIGEFRCPFTAKRLFDLYLDENGNVVIVFVCNRCKLKCRIYITGSDKMRIEPKECFQALNCTFQDLVESIH